MKYSIYCKDLLSLFNIQNSNANITKKYQKAAFLIRFVIYFD